MKIQALTGSHDRNGFDCGVEVLNLWLQKTALQHQAKGISRTFVAMPSDAVDMQSYRSAGYDDIGESSILGFYALASAFILADDLGPELARRYPRQIPVTRLSRLGIHSDLQGQGIGRLLLADAARFYAQYGFIGCKERPLTLHLPMW